MATRRDWKNSVLFALFLCVSIYAENNGSIISRKHVGVWFDYAVRYYDHEADNAYSKQDLRTMIDVVGKRFGRIAIDNVPLVEKLPPGPNDHSRVWIPSVAAQHNKDNPTNPVEVLVSFDVAKLSRSDQLKSFDIAKYMADSANDIYPGTVKTLMMFSGFSIFSLFYNNVKETIQQLKDAREQINASNQYENSTKNYDLGIFLDLKDCGHFKGTIGQKMKDVVPHIELAAFLLRPNYHHMSLKPEVIHKMFIAKFEDCERKLKTEKSKIKVLPVVLWMSRKGSSKTFIEFWGLMSSWAKKNGKEVIMYEAFDTPNGRLISDQGWWRLKNKAEHEIHADMFIEKIQEINGTSSNALEYSTEESSDEDNDNSSGSTKGKSSFRSSSYSEPQPPNSVYIVIVLLCVICTMLVAVIVGLVWGFHSVVLRHNYNTGNGYATHMNGSSSRYRYQHRHRQQSQNSNQDEDGDGGTGVNGSVLEIRDTESLPIVAVTYRK